MYGILNMRKVYALSIYNACYYVNRGIDIITQCIIFSQAKHKERRYSDGKLFSQSLVLIGSPSWQWAGSRV